MTSVFGIPLSTVAAWMVAAVGAVLLVLLVLAGFNRVLLKMSIRNIPRRRAQTALILFGLMLATLIITASLGVGDTLSYSLQSIQVRQTGGIDEGFTRLQSFNAQGAGTSSADFFSNAQAADVIARSKSDTSIAAAAGTIVAPGSMIDATTNQTCAQNVAIFGVAPDFASVWGTLRSRSSAAVDLSSLGPGEVIIGNSLATRLNAKRGDLLHMYVDGHPVDASVKDVLDTEVNPSIANHGPIVNSVLMPLSTMRSVMQRPSGFNLILLHNQGSGGIDDLGPGGVTGDGVTRTKRAAFTDSQGAAQLKDFLNTPAIKEQIKRIGDQAIFLDPTKDLSRRLLVELDRPEVSDEFKSLAANQFVEFVMDQAAASSIPRSTGADAAIAAQEQLTQLVVSLHVDSASAGELKSFLGGADVLAALRHLMATLPASDPTRKAIADLITEVQAADVTPKFKAMVASPELQKELGQAIATASPNQVAAYEEIAGRLNLYVFNTYKADAVTFAQRGGMFATAALLGVSFFSIAVGVLLIFLIFVMLAAERRAEMGMSRAVGLKRRHLTQMFLFEGTAYTLAASVVGVAGGVLVGMLMASVLSKIFGGFYSGLTLEYHVEWTSLVISFCLGMLLTFGVVAVSAYKVSRLNIVAAIRDLDESEARDAGMLRMFSAVFTTAWAGARQLVRGHPLVFLSRVTLGVLGAIWTFWWALFKRGPMTVLFGIGVILAGIDIQYETLYAAGVSLVIIGVGLLARWVLSLARVRSIIAARIGFSIAALGLLIYWGRPFGRVEKLMMIDGLVQLNQLSAGPELFALSALMVLLGVIWLVMYNSDLLIRGVMFFTARVGSLAPITRTGMAYPMATKFRTGMAVAMFAIVTFMIVFMSVFQDVLIQNFAQVDRVSGEWQIVAGTPDQNFQQSAATVFSSDITSLAQSESSVSADLRGVGWENESLGVNLQQVNADGTVTPGPNNRIEFRSLHVVDDGYLATTGYSLKPRAAAYATDRAAWDAVRNNVGFAVINSSLLAGQNGSPAAITGIKPSDSTFQPFQVRVTPANTLNGAPSTWTLTVVGFMPDNGIWNGTYVSMRTAMASGLFAPPAVGTTPPPSSLGALTPLVPTGYYFALKPGVDSNKARLDLGRMLVKDQVEPVIVADQIAQQLSGILTLLKLITGFLALGLIVGIAGLGVISTRAVVERWQQIGMLRALGYRRSLVQRSFLLESSLIAILGLVIGALVGLWQSYRFFVTDKTFGVVDFHIPVLGIATILVVAYLATLLTTFLPAQAASQVAPAEALRYE